MSEASPAPLLTRRGVLGRGAGVSLAMLISAALPLAEQVPAAEAADPIFPDATLQAFADTMIPGRKIALTESGNPINQLAIAGVDPQPGAVEADALELFHHPEVGFDVLEPAFLADLQARSLLQGGDFLHLDYDGRVAACLSGLDFSNPTRLIWEAAAAVPFTAFCAAALIRNATAAQACGYQVMGLPGIAPDGYSAFSYQRALSRELTQTGSLP